MTDDMTDDPNNNDEILAHRWNSSTSTPKFRRRRFLAGAGVAAGAAWVVPSIVSAPAASANTAPPGPVNALAVGQFFAPRAWATSNFGVDWNQPVAALPDDAYAIAANGAGRWVVVGKDQAWWSTDAGVTWNAATVPLGFDCRAVAAGGSGPTDEWFAVGQSPPFLFTSTDGGGTWAGVPAAVGQPQSGVASDGAGNWITVGAGDSYSRIAFWGDNDPLPAGYNGVAVATDGSGTWVVVGPTGAWTLTAPACCPWTTGTVPADWDAQSVATDGAGRWVAVGRNATNSAFGDAWYSTDDGATWTAATTPPNTPAFSVATDGAGRWIAVGSAVPGGGSWTSVDDGVTWQQSAIPITGLATAVAFDRLLP